MTPYSWSLGPSLLDWSPTRKPILDHLHRRAPATELGTSCEIRWSTERINLNCSTVSRDTSARSTSLGILVKLLPSLEPVSASCAIGATSDGSTLHQFGDISTLRLSHARGGFGFADGYFDVKHRLVSRYSSGNIRGRRGTSARRIKVRITLEYVHEDLFSREAYLKVENKLVFHCDVTSKVDRRPKLNNFPNQIEFVH